MASESILAALTEIANDWHWLALAWHILLAAVLMGLVAGWRPSSRLISHLLVAPLLSVSLVAWLSGNPFNGTAFGVLAATLLRAAKRFSKVSVQLDSPGWVAPGVALCPFPIRPDRSFVQHRIPNAQVEAVHQQAVLAAGIDNHFGAYLPQRSIVRFDRHTSGSIVIEHYVHHAHAFVRFHAMLARIVQHHLIELAAGHLPGLRALMGFVVPEIKGRRQFAVRVDELHAVLLDEVAVLHFRQHVQALQNPISLGNQRFTDVETRETLALETVKLAIDYGIDVNAANVDGRTALDAAKALKFERLTAYLVQQGAKPGVTDKKDEPRP